MLTFQTNSIFLLSPKLLCLRNVQQGLIRGTPPQKPRVFRRAGGIGTSQPSQGSRQRLHAPWPPTVKVWDGSGPHLGFLFPDHFGYTQGLFPYVFSSCATAHPIPLPPLLRAWRLVLKEVRGLALAGRDQVPVGAAAILAQHPAAPPPISGLLGGTCRGCSTSAPLFK